MLHSSVSQHGKRSKKTYTYKYIYVNTLLKIKQKKKTIRGAVFVRRLRLVAYIQRTLLLLMKVQLKILRNTLSFVFLLIF